MQRTAASNPPTALQYDPQVPTTLSSKRQKTSHTPSSAPDAPSDVQLIQAAMEDEEEKREKAIEKLAEEAGETKWVLSTTGKDRIGMGGRDALRITTTGYSDLDQEGWRPATVGRRAFGKFKRKWEVSSDEVNIFSVLLDS